MARGLRALISIALLLVAGCSSDRPDPMASCASRPDRTIVLTSKQRATIHRGEAVTVDRRLPEGRVADGINIAPTDSAVRVCADDPFRIVGVRRGTVTISGFQNTNLMQPANFAVLEVK